MADFSPAAMARIQKVVPYVEHSMRNTLPRRARWHGGGNTKERHFELKDALTPGGTADAYPLGSDGEPITDDPDVVFEVVDARGVYRGRAKDEYNSPHDQGSRGEAKLGSYYDDEGEQHVGWLIQWLTPHALAIHGTLYEDLATSDETFQIEAIEAQFVLYPDGAIVVDQDPGDVLTIANGFSMEGDEGGYVHALWNASYDNGESQSPGRWETNQVQCKE